ncbi:MAG TPA: sulfite exporter TauE/SafE family protein [Burkholderiaceae bacterium]|nr:sulfite exporter TauE/SafE family protein [Burkholderiaceae bacterium]
MVYIELLIAGIASGFLAGLLGIGGGFVVVPVLMLLLPQFDIAPNIAPQVAVATSLAAMVPTAVSALLTQHRRGFLDTRWVSRLAPGAAAGALTGAQLAKHIHGAWIAGFFALYAGYFALKMLRDPVVDPNHSSHLARLIARVKRPWVALGIGGFSALAGVGGASLTIPYLLLAKVDMRRAVAVSSAVGLAIAAAGALSFATGVGPVAGDKTLVGLVCWPAALTIAMSAIWMAPRGVAASHGLPVRQLKRAFGGVLLAVCVTTLVKLAEPPVAPIATQVASAFATR